MLRSFQNSDLDALLAVWLEGNLDAHPFIPAAYWEGNLALVRELLPQSELLIAEEKGEIRGFLGLLENEIAGIFVVRAARSQGVGRRLLEGAKALRPRLALHVYEKNVRAQSFYAREGFTETARQTDEATGEQELTMEWRA